MESSLDDLDKADPTERKDPTESTNSTQLKVELADNDTEADSMEGELSREDAANEGPSSGRMYLIPIAIAVALMAVLAVVIVCVPRAKPSKQ